MKRTNERLVPFYNEGNCYFIYFTGDVYLENDKNGKIIEKEIFYYLDDKFNRFVKNYNKDIIEELYSGISKKNEKLGDKVFIGPHSPEIECNNKYVLNSDKETLGIWQKPSKEELLHYNLILGNQNKERHSVRLSY